MLDSGGEGTITARWIIHLDMDAFYAAVEQRDRPDLRGKPVIVGGPPGARGVVSTCSYEARRYGVRSAMPLREAAGRCPDGIFVPVRMARYVEVSRQVFAILDQYSPLVEPLSLDEAFLDVTGCEMLFGPAVCIARQLVVRVQKEIGLSASVGVAPNKFLAKVASDLRKPGGFVVVRHGEEESFLAELPVSRLWGVGPKTEDYLRRIGIRTIAALRAMPREALAAALGESGILLYDLCRGVDERPVAPCESAKSIGQEVTFQHDTDDRDYLAGTLLLLSDRVARRARKAGVYGRTVVLKLRDLDFVTVTRRRTLDRPTDREETIYTTAKELAEALNWGRKKVRLIGVSLTNITDASMGRQGALFGEANEGEKLDRLHRAVDAVRERYGESAIQRAGSLRKEPGRHQ
ncbi:MAG: DNA polymerase IV [Bacteroidota bacterium]